MNRYYRVVIAVIVAYGVYLYLTPDVTNGHFVLPSQASTTQQGSTSPRPRSSGHSPTRHSSSAPPIVSSSPLSLTPRSNVTGCKGPVIGAVIPSLGTSAKTVPIGLMPDGTLGAPSDADRQFVGVYTGGPQPGDPGNVLLDGHAYIDGSSVFHSDFGEKMKKGAKIQLVKARCTYTYRVDRVWPTLAKQRKWTTSTAPYFGDIVGKFNLFRGTGPSGLTLMTCSGKFDYSLGHHEDEAVVHADLVSIS